MTEHEPPRRDHDEPSLLQRLREALGTDVDPGISLDPSTSRPAPASRSGDSSGTLRRLGEHTTASTRYRVHGEIARGGMGAILEVWDEDLRRRLAMKVALGPGEHSGSTRPSDLDPRVLARFLEEAQVTGQLDHPGIVPVHELGLDDRGQLYFTMRLVQGRDLEDVFQLVATGAEGWTRTRALGVILKACEAMAYAHDKGVIHRDLKPANLMVGRFGEVYVMDWGVARVKGHEDRHDLRVRPASEHDVRPLEVDRREDSSGVSRAELYTMDGDVLGTPAYMSPEQALGKLDAIDPRSDVYAMGALLYRLLAGASPYSRPGEKRRSHQVLNDIVDGPPPRLEELVDDVPDELVAITEKAMARASEDRYADMLELAEDLRAFLEDRVVRAYETGALAEARKWVRRNRPLAAALAAGVLALVGGLTASLVLKRRSDENAVLAETRRGEAVAAAGLAEERRVEAERLADLAEDRRLEADRNAEEARRRARTNEEVVRFLNEDLLAAASPGARGIDVTVREVLDIASRRLDGRFRDDPLVEAELRLTLGSSYLDLGRADVALGHLERARELHAAQLGPRDRETLKACQALAEALTQLDRHDEAEALLRETLATWREDFGAGSPGALTTQNALAGIHVHQERFDEGIALFEEVLERQRATVGEEAPDTLVTRNDLGLALTDLGRFEDARPLIEGVYEVRVRKDGEEHPETLVVSGNLANLYEELGLFDESAELQERMLDVRRRVLGARHVDVAMSLNNLGALYVRVGRGLEALGLCEESLEIFREVLGPEHHDTLNALNTHAVALELVQRKDEALEVREELVETLERVLGPAHTQTLTACNNLANLYRDLGRYDEAIALFEKTYARYEETLGPEHPTSLLTLENLSGVHFTMGNHALSAEILPLVLEGRIEALGEDHPDVAKTLYNLAMVEKAGGDLDRALELLEDVLERNLASVGTENLVTGTTYMQIANLHSDRQEYEAAIENYRRALAVVRPLNPDAEEVGYFLHQIGYGHFRLEQWDEAIEALREGLAERRRVLGDRAEYTLTTMAVTASALRKAGRFEESEPLALEFREGVMANGGASHPHYQNSLTLLRKLYDEWGKPDEAAKWAAQ